METKIKVVYKEKITEGEHKFSVKLNLPNGVSLELNGMLTRDAIEKVPKEACIGGILTDMVSRLIGEIKRDNSLLSTIENK